MKTRQEVLNFGLSFPNTYVDAPFHDDNWQLVRCGKNNKVFLWTFEREGNLWINIKIHPEWGLVMREMYSSVIPAYHLNKKHWNSVILNGSVPDEEIKRMITESYDLVMMKKR